VKLWIARGFGVGRIPVAPGTWGSAVGLLWFFLLLAPGSLVLFLLGATAGVAASVWLCGRAEHVLAEKDPPSVVLDEIVAMPVCFVAWLVILMTRQGSMPAPRDFLSSQAWLLTIGVFLTFRLFDVVKPWPVRQSQRLPGGWGITVDDLLAALYVNVVVLLAFAARRVAG
jgi:phosphatidylglycerophosphatase A